MKEYIGAFLIGVGFTIASIVLPIIYPSMQHSIAVALLWIGIIFILIGLILPFIPLTKKAKSKKEEKHQSPNRKVLAHQIGIDVKEFEKRFNAIENYKSQDEGANLYNSALEVLVKLDNWLTESDFILKNAVQIKNTINDLKGLFDKYNSTLKIHFMNVGSVNLNWKAGVRPPETFSNIAEETRELLWGTKGTSYKVQINDLINRLTLLLNEEINDGIDRPIIYDDLILKGEVDQSYKDLNARIYAGLDKQGKVWIFAKNGKKTVYDCDVTCEKFEYKGVIPDDIWRRPISDFDSKAMKWDVGFNPINGKIDLDSNDRKKLEIAVSFPQPNACVRLSYLDGYSKENVWSAVYRMTLRVHGKILVNDKKEEIKARWYRVEFEYNWPDPAIKNIKVYEYDPEKETN